jgi:hypothetical protein
LLKNRSLSLSDLIGQSRTTKKTIFPDQVGE